MSEAARTENAITRENIRIGKRLLLGIGANFQRDYGHRTSLREYNNVLELWEIPGVFRKGKEVAGVYVDANLYRKGESPPITLTLMDPRLDDTQDYVKGFMRANDVPEEKIRVQRDF